MQLTTAPETEAAALDKLSDRPCGVAHAFLRAVSPFVATSSLDVARAFSVLCRAFEPDISESI